MRDRPGERMSAASRRCSPSPHADGNPLAVLLDEPSEASRRSSSADGCGNRELKRAG